MKYREPKFVYRAHKNNSFRQHIIDWDEDYFGQITVCNINIPTYSVGKEFNWYYEHEREDVEQCKECF